MRKRIIIISLTICMVSLFGCTDKNKPAEEFHPYQKVMQLETTLETPDPNWIEQTSQQLINT